MENQLMMIERMKADWVDRLAALSRHDMSPSERKKLAAAIRFDRLPRHEREVIAAALETEQGKAI